jgi:7,8-dihydropterin-6-yl-methyl-4-(beta-D-ribofuranosyl)aminobenzene 5'-phosphate synthase
MTLKITTLIENNPGEHKALAHEHGLSFFVETDHTRILFDTGQSGKFLANADLLNIDLSRLDSVMISHGHYDHSGGFRALTARTTRFNLFLGQGFFQKKYGQRGYACEYLGNSFDEDFLSGQGIPYRFVHEPLLKIAPDVFILSRFDRVHEDETINPRFKLFKDGQLRPDPFEDEIALAMDSPRGLVVLLGCSHPGMKNILDAAVRLTGKPVCAVLGGTHLVEATESSLDMSLDYLQNATMKIVGLSHCTGQTAMERLATRNSNYFQNRTGTSLFID